MKTFGAIFFVRPSRAAQASEWLFTQRGHPRVSLIGLALLLCIGQPGQAGESPAPTKDTPPKPEHAEKLKELPQTPKSQKLFHVILRTTLGILRIQLEHDSAPEHTKAFLTWCRAGIYEGTRFNRVDRGFHIEAGYPVTRVAPLSAAQKALIKKPALEEGVPQTFGSIALIPHGSSKEDPNATAFSIYIGHQIKYVKGITFFGRVVDGRQTLRRISDVRVNKIDFPVHPLIILKTELVDPQYKVEYDPDYAQLLEERYVSMADPKFINPPKVKPFPAIPPERQPAPPEQIILILALLLILFGWGTLFLGTRKDPRQAAGLGALAMLIGGFSIFSTYFEASQKSPQAATLLFFGTLVVFWLLSYVDRKTVFELPLESSPGTPSPTPASPFQEPS